MVKLLQRPSADGRAYDCILSTHLFAMLQACVARIRGWHAVDEKAVRGLGGAAPDDCAVLAAVGSEVLAAVRGGGGVSRHTFFLPIDKSGDGRDNEAMLCSPH